MTFGYPEIELDNKICSIYIHPGKDWHRTSHFPCKTMGILINYLSFLVFL